MVAPQDSRGEGGRGWWGWEIYKGTHGSPLLRTNGCEPSSGHSFLLLNCVVSQTTCCGVTYVSDRPSGNPSNPLDVYTPRSGPGGS